MKKKRLSANTPRLGQHFLRGTWAARALVDAAHISRGEIVLEIGPGEGALTRELLATGASVIAIEKDPALVAKLQEVFPDEIAQGQLKVVEADIRDVSGNMLGLRSGGYSLAANIPYYITGEIIRTFLTEEAPPRTMALLIQKEVAQRIVSKKESILSLSVKAFGTPKIAAKVSRGNFSPPPSVDSAILVVDSISRDFFEAVDEKSFFSLVRAGFASKRKLLAGNISKQFGSKTLATEALARCGIPENARAEEVPLEKWKLLASELNTRGG